jgi:hypothetical protein
VSSCYFREPEGLEENSKEGEGSVNGEWSIDKDRVSCVSGREITQTMVHEEDSSQKPEQANECQDIQMEELEKSY